ncbi:MAG: 30S ribosomal protein S3ae [Candidatus Aenigmatarchaeota archaeon]
MASKLKGKDWYKIVAPKFFGDFVIGETISMDPKNLINRVVEASLMDITGDTSKYYIILFFKVKEVQDNKAITKFFGHNCTRDFIARIVQKRTTRIDTNDIINLKDEKMRVKSIVISNRRVSRTLKTEIRKLVREKIINELSKMKTEEFVKEMIDGKIQSKIKKEVSKTYPIRFFEFRKTQVL